jgi:hypothetical protein
MVSRFTLALPVATLGLALLAPSAHAQGRGMRGFAAAPRGGRSSTRVGGRGDIARQGQRRFLNNSAYLFPPYFYDDGIDEGPGGPQVQVSVSQSAQPPAPPAKPIEPLLLENRDGQWVRVPTGSQMQAISDSTQLSGLQPGITVPAGVFTAVPELPPAQIVFRDGHTEEVQKYMIQGGVLYTTSDYWTTGSWTRKIPLAELDIPASLKLNKERGTKFNLPSGPNEVAIRF